MKRKVLFVLAATILLISLFLTFLHLTDAVSTLTDDLANNNLWGFENSLPWYYASSRIYTIYTLSSGLIYLLAAVIIALGIREKNNRIIMIGELTFFVDLLILIISIWSTNAPA